MDLFFRQYGDSPSNLIILHGLYGASDNWVTFGKKLSAEHAVYLVDQRNHGNSPHHQEHNYCAMRKDLLAFFDKHNIEQATLVGHSMGGKAAISFTAKHPDRVKKLIVVDVSPRNYHPLTIAPEHILMHKNTIEQLLSLPTDSLTSRTQADDMLSVHIPSKKLRQFLLKNLKHDAGRFTWKFNLAAIANNLENILNNGCLLDGNKIQTDTLFIRGSKSEYLTEKDYPFIRENFAQVNFSTIQDAGHWVHTEQPEQLLKTLKSFI